MGQVSNIAWTHSTLNWWIGCTKIAPECAHCYAAALDEKRFSKMLGGATTEAPVSHWGKGAPRHLTKAATDGTLARWNKQPWYCPGCGDFFPATVNLSMRCPMCDLAYLERRRVFIGSLMDWADEEVPDAWRDTLFDQADRATDLTLMFLTKRGDNALRYLTHRYRMIPPHFWIGYSYMHGHPKLGWLHEVKDMGARITFLSCEPMLARAKLHLDCQATRTTYRHLGGPRGIDWVILGGESQEPGGPEARPCSIEWIRDGIAQCRAGEAAPFVKQLGSQPYRGDARGNPCVLMDLLKHPKGADPAEWPEDIRVQEVPA